MMRAGYRDESPLQGAPSFLLTGPLHGGKTTCLREIMSLLEPRGFRISGFIASGMMKDGTRTGFTLEDLRTGGSTLLSTTTPGPDTVRWGRFYFTREGIEAGFRALAWENTPVPDLTVVDEVGPFELQDGIWAHHLDEMAIISPRPFLWVVREALVDQVIEHWHLRNPCVLRIPLDATGATELIEEKIRTWHVLRK